ncbi:sensor histidine kinase [Pseudochryseolinea flava]|nr:sensor histidine kinase [Pseudochryseolinea flava]
MKISYFIFLGFFTILALFTVATAVNLRLSEKVNENSEFFEKSTTVVRSSNRFQRNILNMISGLRGYLFTGESSFLQSYDSAVLENNDLIHEMELMTFDSSSQLQDIKQIKALNNRWLQEFATPLINAKRNADLSDSSLQAFQRLYREKLNTGFEKQINNRLQAKLRDFSNYEYDRRAQRKITLEQSIKETRTISFLLTTVSVAIGLLIAGFLAYRISTRMVQLVRMADEIAGGNYLVHVEDSGKDELSGLASALNHMSKTLSENIALLKRKNRELDQFAHIVSHDLKAPLRGIDNVATWIEEDHLDELSPKVKEYLALIKGRVVRAENLIRGILSYARIGRESIEKEMVDVGKMLQEIQESIPMKPGVSINIAANMPVFVTEKLPLQMIFTNLLNNAITYHDKSPGEVTISFESEKNEYRFCVADNGPGIAKHYHDKIFVIFQTLAERDQHESTGVGLAIVKKILDERNETIKIVSQIGIGSKFIFTWSKH